MVVTSWLIDKSALARLHLATEANDWASRISRGLVAVTTVTRLEAGFSARNLAHHEQLIGGVPMALMPVEYLTPAIEDRALAVQRLLATPGHHRAPSVPDLLIAATAELSRRILLHVDTDFELIAEVTGQTAERLNVIPQ